MMENKDLEAEIHPLKNEDRKSQENLGNRLKNEDNLKSAAAQSRLSRCRTVAFFLSLFICLLVVFVVSFIIPCPDRPMSQSMWRIDYNAAGETSGPLLIGKFQILLWGAWLHVCESTVSGYQLFRELPSNLCLGWENRYMWLTVGYFFLLKKIH